MTATVELTYVGRLPRGIVALPGRHVPFTAGTPVTFTVAEAASLDADDWSGPRVPDVAELLARPARDVVAAVAAAPELAAVVLAAEEAGRARKSVVEPIRRLAGTNPKEPSWPSST